MQKASVYKTSETLTKTKVVREADEIYGVLHLSIKKTKNKTPGNYKKGN